MPNDSQNHLSNKWLPWKQNKRYLVYLTFSASLRNTPNSLQNFKFLRVRVLEITEEFRSPPPPPPPQYKVWVPNISVWEGLRASSRIFSFVSSPWHLVLEARGLTFCMDIKSTNLKISNHSDVWIGLLSNGQKLLFGWWRQIFKILKNKALHFTHCWKQKNQTCCIF